MVVATKKSIFIHFPKNAGRWISETFIKNVKGSYYIGDSTYNAHELPSEINGKKVFICVREPSTWLHSLWHHRSRKKGLLGIRSFNWQYNFSLERKSKSRNFNKFLEKAVNLDNPLFEYYSQFIPNVDELYLIYFENLTNSLISFLEFCGEDFDKNGILECSRFPINTTKRGDQFNNQNDFKLNKRLFDKLFKNNKKFFEFTNYGYRNGLLDFPKTFKKITKEELQVLRNKNSKIEQDKFISKVIFNTPKKTFIEKEIYALFSNFSKSKIRPLRYYCRKISFDILILFLKIYINLRYKPCQFEKNSEVSSLCLEFGGGHRPLKRDKGFLNIDIRDLDTVDIVCKSGDILNKVNPKSVTEIFSRHFLEHLTKEELFKHLEDCQILLNQDGLLECIVPSTEYHLIQLFCSEPGSINFNHAFAGFNGWQRGQDQGYWDIHKSSFTYSYLEYILSNHGYKIKFKKTGIKNIHFLATPNRK